MKSKLLFVLVFVCITTNIYSQKSKDVNLHYDEQEFIYEFTNFNELSIFSNKYIYSYTNDVNMPALPYIPVNVAVESNYSFSSISTISQDITVKSNITVMQVPIVCTTSSKISDVKVERPKYAKKIYTYDVKYVASEDYGAYKLLRFLVCPFTYDANKKILYLASNLNLHITLEKDNDITDSNNNNNARVRSICDNPDDVLVLPSSKEMVKNVYGEQKVKYLIVTADSLKDSFMPLVNWKIKKGISAACVTKEDIQRQYGKFSELNLKKYLKLRYEKDGLTYVLLGGTHKIIPTRLSHGEAEVYNDETKRIELQVLDNIPTDLYYQCFDENVDWDANKNGVFGELEDCISMKPCIYLTRTLCHNNADVKVFVDKIISYETAPNVDNTLLMMGKMNEHYGYSHRTCDFLYDNYVKEKWDGSKSIFFEDKSDFGNTNLDDDGLISVLNNGYSFVHEISHGKTYMWVLGDYNYFYSQNVKYITNPKHTIIITDACYTNDFYSRMNDLMPCLSDAFTNFSKSGVVAYIGSSSYGFRNEDKDGGPSCEYDARFYSRLFSNSGDKNFGKIFSDAKYDRINDCYDYNHYRWLQFSLNAIGDPEMPIYTTIPKKFDNVDILSSGTILKIKPNVPNCRVCVMSVGDNGKSYYGVKENEDEFVFTNVDGDVSVVVTKQDYIPYVDDNVHIDGIAEYDNIYIQNETLSGSKTYSANNVYVGSNVTDTKPKGDVRVNAGTYIFDAEKYVIKPNVYVSGDTKIILNRRMK